MAYEIPKGIETNCAPNKRGVIGYEHQFREGKSHMWCTDNDDIRSLGLNDKISFLSVPRGLKVTVYENINKNGLVKTFEEGEWDLHEFKFENGHQLHDRISSIKIEGTAPDAVAASEETQYIWQNRR